jgi:hypothetical protein
MNKAIIYLGYFLLITFFTLVTIQFYNLQQGGAALDASPTSVNVIIILIMLFIRKLLNPELFSKNSQKYAIRIFKLITLFIVIVSIILILILVLYFIFFPMPLSN